MLVYLFPQSFVVSGEGDAELRLGGVCLGHILDLMSLQFDRDDQPRYDRAEGDEQQGEPPLKGGLKPQDTGDRHHDHSGRDQ